MTSPAPVTRDHGPVSGSQSLGLDGPAMRSRERQTGGDTERHRAGEVGEGRVGGAPCASEQRRGAVDGDEREVARRRRDERRQQHAPGQVVLVRHLEGEDRPGGRCLEDGGDAGGRTRHQQHAPTAPGGEAREAPLQERPEVRAQIEGSALEAHRATEHGRRDRRQHPTGELSEAIRLLGIVERLEVEVGHARVT